MPLLVQLRWSAGVLQLPDLHGPIGRADCGGIQSARWLPGRGASERSCRSLPLRLAGEQVLTSPYYSLGLHHILLLAHSLLVVGWSLCAPCRISADRVLSGPLYRWCKFLIILVYIVVMLVFHESFCGCSTHFVSP